MKEGVPFPRLLLGAKKGIRRDRFGETEETGREASFRLSFERLTVTAAKALRNGVRGNRGAICLTDTFACTTRALRFRGRRGKRQIDHF